MEETTGRTEAGNFERETSRIGNDNLSSFLTSTTVRLTQAPGNICQPCTVRGVDLHAPYSHRDYPYRHEVGKLSAQPWLTIFKQRPDEVIPADPYEISRLRGPPHLQLWDACVGIPACSHRNLETLHVRNVPVLRGTNTHWTQVLAQAIPRAGLTINGVTTRITAPWILDLTQMGEEGWWLAELAHTLAHYRADFKRISVGPAQIPSRTFGRLQQAMGLIAVSHFFGLPMFVGEEIDDTRAYPYFRQYGVDVKTTSEFGHPTLMEPCTGNEAPRFDTTVATVMVAVRIEPPPMASHMGGTEHQLADRWAGFPTMAAIIGWERMDVLTHQPLASYYPRDPKAKKCYAIHPADLMPPDTFWNFLALARRARGLPISDSQNMTVQEWRQSPEFALRFNETPPRPCNECLGWQKRSEAAKKRPRDNAPDFQKREYKTEMLRFRKVVRKAELEYQVRVYGSTAARNRINKQRRAAHKVKLQRDRDRKLLSDAKAKVEHSKQLTPRQQKRYKQYRELVVARKRKELECSTSALTTASVAPLASSPKTGP